MNIHLKWYTAFDRSDTRNSTKDKGGVKSPPKTGHPMGAPKGKKALHRDIRRASP